MQTGLILSSFGRGFIVEVNGRNYSATTKSKRTDYVVGDQVQITMINQEQVQITDVIARHNLVYRSDVYKSKIIASNIDQIIIVIAIKPNFNINFLNSCLICAEEQDITPIILINKTDLEESNAFINEISTLYHNQLGYRIVTLSALQNCNALNQLLENKSSLLIGQSGVGKSTITNQIITHANARTDVMTKSEHSGKHTTTNATLYHINDSSSLIDCPGLQEFGLYHLNVNNLNQYFPELREYHDHCRFRNCKHFNEPNCAILEAAKKGLIDASRLTYLHILTQKLLEKPNH